MILLWKTFTNFITNTKVPDQKSLIYGIDKNDVYMQQKETWLLHVWSWPPKAALKLFDEASFQTAASSCTASTETFIPSVTLLYILDIYSI